MKRYGSAAWILIVFLALAGVAGAAENLLKNPSFEAGFSEDGVPEGWQKYGTPDASLGRTERSDTAAQGRRGLLICDEGKKEETGVSQTVKVGGGGKYRVSVKCRKVGSTSGSYVQMRFHPSNEFKQTGLAAKSDQEFTEVGVEGLAPEGTNRITVYIYTHKSPMPKVIVDDARLEKVED